MTATIPGDVIYANKDEAPEGATYVTPLITIIEQPAEYQTGIGMGYHPKWYRVHVRNIPGFAESVRVLCGEPKVDAGGGLGLHAKYSYCDGSDDVPFFVFPRGTWLSCFAADAIFLTEEDDVASPEA